MPRRGENIFKRKDGRWEARYIEGISLDGTKKYSSVYAKTYREAKEKRLARLSQSLIDTKKSAGDAVENVMQKWLEQSKNQLKITSYQRYETIVQNHIISRLGKIPIRRLTSDMIMKFTDELLNDRRLSRETVNQILIVLGMGLSFAKSEYCAVVPEIRLLKSAKPKTRVLSVSEQQILVQYLLSEDDIFSFGILLALYTGLRIGELCALCWEDFSEHSIHVHTTMQRVKGDSEKTEIMLLPPKTSASDRVVPIAATLTPLIERYRQESGYVLTRLNGKFTEPRLLQNKFSNYIKACGIENAHFHTLRHTFATRCVESGMDIKSLSEILGHSDVKTTLNKYVHSSFELKQSEIDRLTLLP